jgi:hypothetical protein
MTSVPGSAAISAIRRIWKIEQMPALTSSRAEGVEADCERNAVFQDRIDEAAGAALLSLAGATVSGLAKADVRRGADDG